MSSGSANRYFQKLKAKSKFIPEGVEGERIQGKYNKNNFQLKGGLRSSMGYIEQKLSHISKNAKFAKLPKLDFMSMVHSVEVTKETANYKL